jgi:hypothetical protein
VYDITNTPNSHANEAIKTLNRFTRDTFGLGGIFHGAVEVNGCAAERRDAACARAAHAVARLAGRGHGSAPAFRQTRCRWEA